MSSLLVCDASVLVALLLDSGPDGAWAAKVTAGAVLSAPALCRFEAANIIRRLETARLIGGDQAVQAHVDLLDLRLRQYPYEALAPRLWGLRPNLTVYDASYVALAELLDAPFATLDRRITRAPGVRCEFLTP